MKAHLIEYSNASPVSGNMEHIQFNLELSIIQPLGGF